MKKLWIVLSLSLLFVSCATLPGRKASRDILFSPELRGEVVSSVRQRNDSIRSLRGFANVRYGSSVFGARGETSFAIKRPYHLRIDGLSDFGLYNSQLVIERGDLTILWPGDNSYYRGLASPQAMERYLMVSLTPEEAIEILLGVVPLEDEVDYAVKTPRREGLVLQGGRGEMIVESRDGSYLPIQYTSYDTDGLAKYRINYSDYQREGDLWFAERLLVRFFDPRSRIEILYKEVEINPTIENKMFEIKIPGDAKQLEEIK